MCFAPQKGNLKALHQKNGYKKKALQKLSLRRIWTCSL